MSFETPPNKIIFIYYIENMMHLQLYLYRKENILAKGRESIGNRLHTETELTADIFQKIKFYFIFEKKEKKNPSPFLLNLHNFMVRFL